MKKVLFLLVVCLFILVTESARIRRQYRGYGYAQQYGLQYGLYGPGGQGFGNNNMNNLYPNQQGYGWNNNFNWNQALIHTCGCLVPSVLSAFYFLVSLGLALWWALGKHFGRAYLCIIRLLQIYSVSHLLIIYLYQLPFIEQYLLKPNTQII